MNELNEILLRVTQLTPAELLILQETAKALQTRAANTLCIDSDAPEKKTDDLMIDEI